VAEHSFRTAAIAYILAQLEGETEVRVMRPGDYVHIPAHRRHRVEWTDREQKTVWLALHYQ
jgi:cupin 2 domain-containing protein